MSGRLVALALILAAAVVTMSLAVGTGLPSGRALADQGWAAVRRPAPPSDPRRPRRAPRRPPPGPMPRLLVDLRTRVEHHVGVIVADCPPRVTEARAGRDVSPTRDDIAVTIQCAQSLARRGVTFWTYWELHGIDTTVFEGLAGNARSEILRFVGSSGFSGRDGLHQFAIGPGRDVGDYSRVAATASTR